MKKINIQKLVRSNILKLKPYECARDNSSGDRDYILLDANENRLGYGFSLPVYLKDLELNIYPDPYQNLLKKGIKKVIAGSDLSEDNIFISNGSDEVIDTLIRIFCEPGKDKILINPPTFGMYKVCADMNDVGISEICLTEDFQLDTAKILSTIKKDKAIKMLFICSPNNPTGNCMLEKDILKIIENFNGIIVIDEAYIDFSGKKSGQNLIKKHNNIIVLQTFSKSRGLAGIRLGVTFADKEVIELLNKLKMPYNSNKITQALGLESLKNQKNVLKNIKNILEERDAFRLSLKKIKGVEKIYNTDSNFILVKFKNAKKLSDYLEKNGFFIRYFGDKKMLENCIRMSMGTNKENNKLIKLIGKFYS